MSVTVTNSPLPLTLVIRPQFRKYSVVVSLFLLLLALFEINQLNGGYPLALLLGCIVPALELISYFTSREQLDLYEDHLVWRQFLAGFTRKSIEREYAAIHKIEWHEKRHFLDFSQFRMAAFKSNGQLPIKVAKGSTESDLKFIRSQISTYRPELALKFVSDLDEVEEQIQEA
jgi:hypothetical protein